MAEVLEWPQRAGPGIGAEAYTEREGRLDQLKCPRSGWLDGRG